MYTIKKATKLHVLISTLLCLLADIHPGEFSFSELLALIRAIGAQKPECS